MTVLELAQTLEYLMVTKQVSPKAKVIMASDAEGNQLHSYDAPEVVNRRTVLLWPAHDDLTL